ncbi:hypothetical protein H5410_059808 [Solanum commersonii]|uniref:Uncharacterized protein n=1 Tax=Solanum commersonii TaxID=4109 RepID=A0A9J5W3I1_SOLCO|nr:hypothetical protein H5410_059808 [Solanum commersonii]
MGVGIIKLHVFLLTNQYLNVVVDPKSLSLPHEFILDRNLLAQFYPRFAKGATHFFSLILIKMYGGWGRIKMRKSWWNKLIFQKKIFTEKSD